MTVSPGAWRGTSRVRTTNKQDTDDDHESTSDILAIIPSETTATVFALLPTLISNLVATKVKECLRNSTLKGEAENQKQRERKRRGRTQLPMIVAIVAEWEEKPLVTSR